MKLTLFPLLAISLLGLVAAAPHVEAVSVVWDSPNNITSSATQVRTDGTFFGGWAWTGPGTAVASVVVNGVTFQKNTIPNTNTAGSNGNLAWTASRAYTNSTATSPYAGLDASYKTILGGYMYSQNGGPGSTNQINLTFSGLTAGKTYLVQAWAEYSGAYGPLQTYTITGATGSTTASANTTAAVGGLGQFIVAHVTMGTGETSFVLKIKGPGSSDYAIVSAIQLREVPKTTWMKDAGYGLFVHWLPSLNGVPAPTNTLAKIVSGTDSLWSNTVAGFNVTNFANQVQETGAEYVIFSIGQTSGYYVSWNNTFETMTRTLMPSGEVQGPLARGEFTPHRDLIADMADALNARGIQMMVYLAADGPKLQNYLLRTPGGQQIYPCLITNAIDEKSPGVIGSAYSACFRTKYNAMIQEWSDRWGSKVAGWWFDGVFPESGYTDVGSDNGTGLVNLNAMIAAAKHGNPASLVACNPGADSFTALSAEQDYLASELGRYQDGRAKFYEYPASPYVVYGGKNVQWHVLSYLGTWWARDDIKFVNEEIINYISSVNKFGGAVSVDVAVDVDGDIMPNHLAQMKRVKAALRPTTAPVVPQEIPPANVSLALYKPTYLKKNSDGSRLAPSYGFQLHQHAGVDGDSATFAAAAVDYAYTFVVDLESAQNFDRVVVTMPAANYATSYEMKYSNTGATGPWTAINSTVPTYSNASGGVKVHNTDGTKNGRWLMIKALAPSASGQPGNQLGVQEFEVYNVSGTLPAADETVWVDEEFPTGSTVTTGGSGTWQTTSTMYSSYNYPSDSTKWWSTISATGVPVPWDGVKLHWNKLASGWNEHGFSGASAPLRVNTGDTLYCDVYLDPVNPPSEVMLIWTDSTGSAEHRAFWGTDSLGVGILGTNSRRSMGSLPTSGQWVRLEVPASQIGLEGLSVTGMSFSTYNGRTFFDRAGKYAP